MLEANQSVITRSVIVPGDAGVLRRISGGRSRILNRNPLSLIVLRGRPSQDLSRCAGIVGARRRRRESRSSPSQDLSRCAGIVGAPAGPGPQRGGGVARPIPLRGNCGVNGSRGLARGSGCRKTYPAARELWGARHHAALRGRKIYPAAQELRKALGVRSRLHRAVAGSIPLRGN